jgi:prophage regulatory protein
LRALTSEIDATLSVRNFKGILGILEGTHRFGLKEGEVALDMLDRLILDPWTRTIGELMQEREWAVGEIRRLREGVGRLSRKEDAVRIEREMSLDVVDAKRPDPTLNAQRLLRLAEVITMIGLCRSSIYRYVGEGRLPAPIKVGFRSVRWKLTDVLAWRQRVSAEG